jgi:hypothetical protein
VIIRPLIEAIWIIREGLPGIIAVTIPAVVLFVANRGASLRSRLLPAMPNVVVILAFLAASYGSLYTAYGASSVPAVTFILLLLFSLSLVFVTARSFHASRVWYVLHIVTLLGTAYLYLIGVMAISHDWI